MCAQKAVILGRIERISRFTEKKSGVIGTGSIFKNRANRQPLLEKMKNAERGQREMLQRAQTKTENGHILSSALRNGPWNHTFGLDVRSRVGSSSRPDTVKIAPLPSTPGARAPPPTR